MKRSNPQGDSGGGFYTGLRRIFGDGENPLEWSLPFGRIRGISLRVHLVFPIYVVSQLIWSISRDRVGTQYLLPLMTSFFVVVLAHELGHCYACRRVGGRVEKIILWPLGGLGETFPPPQWRSSLVSALGGPFVNLALFPILAFAVYIATGNARAVFFLPLEELKTILDDVRTPGDRQPFWLLAVWSLHYANAVVLLFNLLFPMLPLDGGRVMHAVLWRKFGWKHAMEITTVVGIVFGGVLGVFAVAGGQSVLLVIAGLGIWVCYQEHRRLKFLEHGGEESPIGELVVGEVEREQGEPESGAASQIDQEEVDRVLAKISRVGMEGLSVAEKRTLKQATEKNRETE